MNNINLSSVANRANSAFGLLLYRLGTTNDWHLGVYSNEIWNLLFITY